MDDPTATCATCRAPLVWRVPAPVLRHPCADRVTDVDAAIVTPFARGHLGTTTAPTHWLRGAVHDRDGWLVRDSQRAACGTDAHVAADPPAVTIDARGPLVRVPGVPEHLAGRWYYGGHWMAPFGHFLLETLPTLWARRDEPVLYHPFSDDTVEPFQERFLHLAQVTTRPRFVTAPFRVEQLVVATRPVSLPVAASRVAVELWQRVARAAVVGARPAASPTLVALTRSRLPPDRRGTGPARPMPDTAALDDILAAAGFAVVAPEELDVADQVRLVRDAAVLAGVEGSAMHLSAFAKPGCRVLVLGSPRRPVGTYAQRTIDAALGHRAAVVPFRLDVAGRLDLGHVQHHLDALLADADR